MAAHFVSLAVCM